MTVDYLLQKLRGQGLTVAVHNDYKLGGVAYTFWLMVDRTGMSYKGEAVTDIDALLQIDSAYANTHCNTSNRLTSDATIEKQQ